VCSGIHLRGGGGGGGGDGDGGGSLPQRYWAKYLDLLESKPLATKMATGFVIGVFGDLLSQHMSGSKCLLRLSLTVYSLPGAHDPYFCAT